MMARVANAIQNGVTQIHIAGGHIDLCPQHPLTVGEFTSAHALKQVAVLIDAPISEWAIAPRLRQGTAILAGILSRQIAHISEPLINEIQSPLIKLFEIARGEAHLTRPLISLASGHPPESSQ